MGQLNELFQKAIKKDIAGQWFKSYEIEKLLNEGDIIKIEIKEYNNGLKYACKRDGQLMFKKKYNGCIYKWGLKEHKHFKISDKNYNITL